MTELEKIEALLSEIRSGRYPRDDDPVGDLMQAVDDLLYMVEEQNRLRCLLVEVLSDAQKTSAWLSLVEASANHKERN